MVERQKLEVHVLEVLAPAQRLVVSLTPVYRRPDQTENGEQLPIHQLKDLQIGEEMEGR